MNGSNFANQRTCAREGRRSRPARREMCAHNAVAGGTAMAMSITVRTVYNHGRRECQRITRAEATNSVNTRTATTMANALIRFANISHNESSSSLLPPTCEVAAHSAFMAPALVPHIADGSPVLLSAINVLSTPACHAPLAPPPCMQITGFQPKRLIRLRASYFQSTLSPDSTFNTRNHSLAL